MTEKSNSTPGHPVSDFLGQMRETVISATVHCDPRRYNQAELRKDAGGLSSFLSRLPEGQSYAFNPRLTDNHRLLSDSD